MEKVGFLVQQKEWIMDGNYSKTLDIRIPKANIVLFLDFSRLFCIFMVIKRRFAKKNKDDTASWCYEKINFRFYKWIWDFNKRKPNLLKLLNKYGKGKEVFVLRNSKEVAGFIQDVQNKKILNKKAPG